MSAAVVCSTCLSQDRTLLPMTDLYKVCRLLFIDFEGETSRPSYFDYRNPFICWECEAILKKIARFRTQARDAQDYLASMSAGLVQARLADFYLEQPYNIQPLSLLKENYKSGFDHVFVHFDTETDETLVGNFVDCGIRDNASDIKNEQEYDIDIAVTNPFSEVTEFDSESDSRTDDVLAPLNVPTNEDAPKKVTEALKSTVDSPMTFLQEPDILIQEIGQMKETSVAAKPEGTKRLKKFRKKPKNIDGKTGNAVAPESVFYKTVQMDELEMLASRDEAKYKPLYLNATFRCELCIYGFYNVEMLENHKASDHTMKPGCTECDICHVYIEEGKAARHRASHYRRYHCLFCSYADCTLQVMLKHIKLGHTINRSEIAAQPKKKKKKGEKPIPRSKTGYPCPECNQYFVKNSSRWKHIQREHREGYKCDVCNKAFAFRTALKNHMQLHLGPLPREECPVCHKQVRTVFLKYHIANHEARQETRCEPCGKSFLSASTYERHLKNSRAHTGSDVLKIPCPVCDKGYRTKEEMKDHFNYQHMGKTKHQCPICYKALATKPGVVRHVQRAHGERKEPRRDKICNQCGRGFSDKKGLLQHERIHSSERPYTCEVCSMTFRQHSALYTHKKRLHKIFPVKKTIQLME